MSDNEIMTSEKYLSLPETARYRLWKFLAETHDVILTDSDWVDETKLPNNGGGKEYASYLLIEDEAGRRVYSDAMEPEDCRFYRDLEWIKTELDRAHEMIRSRDELLSGVVSANTDKLLWRNEP